MRSKPAFAIVGAVLIISGAVIGPAHAQQPRPSPGAAAPQAVAQTLGMALLGAVVDFDGTLSSDSSSGVVSSRKVATGKYHVIFTRSLLGCTPIVVALGATRLAHLAPGPDSATWEVLTRDPTGQFADSQFSLFNFCAK